MLTQTSMVWHVAAEALLLGTDLLQPEAAIMFLIWTAYLHFMPMMLQRTNLKLLSCRVHLFFLYLWDSVFLDLWQRSMQRRS
jgi:hypothetical protein